MIKGDYDVLKELVKGHECPDHGYCLNVAWHGEENSYVIRCGGGHYPEMITRQLSLTELYKTGEELPSFIEDKIQQRLRRQTMSQERKPVDVQFALVPQTDLATGQLLLPEEVKSLVAYAEKYKLDPYRGHVVLMYGKPYITIDGYLYHAKGTKIPYSLKSRPLTDEEHKLYKIEEEEHAWISFVVFADTDSVVSGMGIVTKAEMTALSKRDDSKLAAPVVAAHPWQLAQKRAEWQALRRAFPIGETKEGESAET